MNWSTHVFFIDSRLFLKQILIFFLAEWRCSYLSFQSTFTSITAQLLKRFSFGAVLLLRLLRIFSPLMDCSLHLGGLWLGWATSQCPLSVFCLVSALSCVSTARVIGCASSVAVVFVLSVQVLPCCVVLPNPFTDQQTSSLEADVWLDWFVANNNSIHIYILNIYI